MGKNKYRIAKGSVDDALITMMLDRAKAEFSNGFPENAIDYIIAIVSKYPSYRVVEPPLFKCAAEYLIKYFDSISSDETYELLERLRLVVSTDKIELPRSLIHQQVGAQIVEHLLLRKTDVPKENDLVTKT